MKTSFEDFKPRLKPGVLSPQEDKVIYESDKGRDQIVFPLQVIDLLLFCDGRRSIREIIELLYKESGRLRFKSIFDTVFELKNRNFLENGEDLMPTAEHLGRKSWLDRFPGELLSLEFARKVEWRQTYPMAFYVLSLLFIAASILCVQAYSLSALDSDLLYLDDSYLRGAFFMFLVLSVLLTGKGFVQWVGLLCLSGRAYNMTLSFSGVAVYFSVSNESLYLISYRVFTLLFHMAGVLSYFSCGWLLQQLFVSPSYQESIQTIVMGMILFELSPLFRSELLNYFQLRFDHETYFRISSWMKNRSLLEVLADSGKGLSRWQRKFCHFYFVAWSLTVVGFFSAVLHANHELLWFAAINEQWSNRIGASVVLLMLWTPFVFFIASSFRFLSQKVWLSFENKLKTLFAEKTKDIDDFNEEALVSILSGLPLFSCLNPSLLKELLKHSRLKSYGRNAEVVRQGELSQSMYILLQGKLRVQKDGQLETSVEESEMRPVSIFGELAAIEEVPRQASIYSKEPSIVLELPAKKIFDLASNSGFIREVNHFSKSIIVSQYFNSAPAFRDLSKPVKDFLLTRGKFEEFKDRQIIFHQGSFGTNFYLILRGAVDVLVNNNLVNSVQQGGFFGEIAVIAKLPRTATVVAKGPCITFSIGSDTFWEAVAQDIELAMVIESVGEKRFRFDIDFLERQQK